jgi:hypothetical protein
MPLALILADTVAAGLAAALERHRGRGLDGRRDVLWTAVWTKRLTARLPAARWRASSAIGPASGRPAVAVPRASPVAPASRRLLPSRTASAWLGASTDFISTRLYDPAWVA